MGGMEMILPLVTPAGSNDRRLRLSRRSRGELGGETAPAAGRMAMMYTTPLVLWYGPSATCNLGKK